MGARLARPRRRRGRRLGSAGEPKPVHLADHRVAGDAAELGGDLARRQAIGPKFLQRLDAFVSPGHASFSSAVAIAAAVAAAEKCRQNPAAGQGNHSVGPTCTPATDLLVNLSAARNVVSDDQKATIWRESGARVRTPR